MRLVEAIDVVRVDRADSSAAIDGLNHVQGCVGAGDVDNAICGGPDGYMNTVVGGIVDGDQWPAGSGVEC